MARKELFSDLLARVSGIAAHVADSPRPDSRVHLSDELGQSLLACEAHRLAQISPGAVMRGRKRRRPA